MMKNILPKLIVFDYSGTLSLGAVWFGRTDNILNQLKQTGLAQVGVKSVDFFWDRIVNPTWHEGSTTSIGYKKLIYRRLKEIASAELSEYEDSQIEKAASRFVSNYLGSSEIDRRWQSLLQELKRISNVRVIIATDHYAEATDAIVKNLKKWRIPAVTTKDPYSSKSIGAFIVANSADIGIHKTKREFWEKVRNHFSLGKISALILIDDFGANEVKKDDYGKNNRVEMRKEKILILLGDVFSAPANLLHFRIDEIDKTGEQESLFLRFSDTVKHFIKAKDHATYSSNYSR
jgi:hypothetical protein